MLTPTNFSAIIQWLFDLCKFMFECVSEAIVDVKLVQFHLFYKHTLRYELDREFEQRCLAQFM